jgi:hypothetical protein
VFRLRRDAGEAKEIAQFVNKAALVGFEIIEDGVHGNFRSRSTLPGKMAKRIEHQVFRVTARRARPPVIE